MSGRYSVVEDSPVETKQSSKYSVVNEPTVSEQPQEQQSGMDLGKIGNAYISGSKPENPMGGMFVGGATAAATETYSQAKGNLLNLLSSKGMLPDSVIGGKSVPIAKTSASILTDIISGFGADAVAGASSGLLSKSYGMLKNAGIDMASTKSTRSIAEGIDAAVDKTHQYFNDSYKPLFEKIGNKMVPDGYKAAMSKQLSEGLQNISPLDPAYNLIENKVRTIIDGGNLTANDLQALKPFTKKMGRAGYDFNKTINSVLGSKSFGGEFYSKLTSSYDSFINDEMPYVEKLIYDTTAGKLTGERLLNSKFDGLVKTPKKLIDNERTALQQFMKRDASNPDAVSQLDALRKGTIVKRVIGGLLTGAAAEIFPPTRKVINSAVHTLG